MRIAVLGSKKSWYVSDLRRAAADRHTLFQVDYRELHSHVVADKVTLLADGEDLSTLDTLLIRTMPPGSLEQVVFRMNALAQLEAAGVRVVNSPRAIEIAVDKYLATAKLQQAGLLVPTTITCQTVEQGMEAFHTLNQDVVFKPVFGSEGRGITRVTDEAIALRTCKALVQIGAILYLQEFIPHEGYDIRLLVIGERVFGMRRRHPHDWRTNISRGAIAEILEVTETWKEMACLAAEAVSSSIAGVDLLPGQDGKLYTLEVNAVPGWQALAQVTGTDIAACLLDFLQK